MRCIWPGCDADALDDGHGGFVWATNMGTPTGHEHAVMPTCPRCGGPVEMSWIRYDGGDGWLTRIPGTYDCALGIRCPALQPERGFDTTRPRPFLRPAIDNL